MSNNSKKDNKKFSLRKLIYNDKYLIIISIVAAVFIWIGTSMNLSPETTKTISVPVKVDFSDSVSQELGIQCYGDESFNVDVTINVKKYLAKDITSDDINVTLQTNSVSTTGTHEVPITVAAAESSDFKIASYYPTIYTAYFDVAQEQEMEINLDYENEDYIADGFTGGQNILSESSVVVSGPKTYVSKINKVVANVNLIDKLSKTTTIDVTPRAVDIYGNTVDYIDIKSTAQKVSLTIPVLKVLDLDVAATLIDVPEGIDESKIVTSYSQQSVKAGVLEDADITDIKLGEISYSKLGVGKNKFTFNVTKLDGITVLDKTKEITVTVNVPSTEYSDKNISVRVSDVGITGLPDGYKASVSSLSTSAITIVGDSSALKSLEGDDITLNCDLTPKDGESIKTGKNNVKISVSFKDAKGVWAYGSYTANVYVSQK